MGPGLALDRTGIALLGAIAFIGLQSLPLHKVMQHVDFSALAILFSFMIISAQFYFSGFYTYLITRLERKKLTPSYLLLIVILISAGLSSVLLNDIVCLALTPLVVRVCFQKKLNPVPFLIGLACASNIGSAITLVGNPQNLLIGQVLNIPFAGYLKYSLIPCLLGLFATWAVIKYQIRNNWFLESKETRFETINFNLWQSSKGVIIVSALLLVFFFLDWPRDQMALVAAGILLLSRRMASQTMLSFIDWQLLVLFIGLFIVNGSFLGTHILDFLPNFLERYNIQLQTPAWISIISALLSNVVSNVPAVMLLLPFVKDPFIGSLLALSSTLAGNLFIVGSIANFIVFSQAERFGVKISWKKHLRVGLPVTFLSFIFLAGWLYLAVSH